MFALQITHSVFPCGVLTSFKNIVSNTNFLSGFGNSEKIIFIPYFFLQTYKKYFHFYFSQILNFKK